MLQVGRLVIIAGPSAAGKSRLIETIMAGGLVALRNQLGMRSCSSCLHIEARELPAIRQQRMDQVILHYDLYTQFISDTGFQHLPDLLPRAENVSVLTLCASTQLLYKRVSSRLISVCNAFVAKPDSFKAERIHRLREILAYYRDEPNLNALYEKWIQFITDQGVSEHLYWDSDDAALLRPDFSPLTAWTGSTDHPTAH